MSRDKRDVLIEFLVIQTQSGNPKAIGQLAELFQQDLVAYAFRLVGNVHTARDVVQEAWLSVLKTIGRLQDPAAFRSWVFRIVHNKSMDCLRYVVRERVELEGLGRSMAANRDTEPAEEDSELVNIQRLIDALPPAERALLVLYYDNELSIREIAAITSNSESATKSRLYQIRQKLKLSLSKLERQNHDREE
ncbi:MAG TPA: RNA polymerase sigma factor [Pirellulaceae bacterium]|nr:RNA polymerase sigma factor [Pirellulaceae bacterium]HMO92429.1 RNA polymerase sigma factor [Pirellulaceae bacterium]HMP67901.1 RNA polymerase sigma factor [Pirellulaceae bacterium]